MVILFDLLQGMIADWCNSSQARGTSSFKKVLATGPIGLCCE